MLFQIPYELIFKILEFEALMNAGPFGFRIYVDVVVGSFSYHLFNVLVQNTNRRTVQSKHNMRCERCTGYIIYRMCHALDSTAFWLRFARSIVSIAWKSNMILLLLPPLPLMVGYAHRARIIHIYRAPIQKQRTPHTHTDAHCTLHTYRHATRAINKYPTRMEWIYLHVHVQ